MVPYTALEALRALWQDLPDPFSRRSTECVRGLSRTLRGEASKQADSFIQQKGGTVYVDICHRIDAPFKLYKLNQSLQDRLSCRHIKH